MAEILQETENSPKPSKYVRDTCLLPSQIKKRYFLVQLSMYLLSTVHWFGEHLLHAY